jgi:hypothetical protein
MFEINVGVLIGGIACAVLTPLIWWLLTRNKSDAPSRTTYHDVQGKVVAIGDVNLDIPQQFKGKGTWSSKPIQLEPGDYRLRYEFSSGAVRVGLVSSFDGEDETLLIKSGNGVEGFGVEAGGRYIFEVQPADETAEWTIEYQHLTRYGAAREEDEGLVDHTDDFRRQLID